MKRVKDIYKDIISIDRLKIASHLASRGKRDRHTVKRFLGQMEQKLKYLHKVLENETYHTMPYNRKKIIDKCTGKIREIFAPKFYPDQIVQWALMLSLEPVMRRGLYDYSCASIGGRGSSYGIKAVKKWLLDKKNTKYALVIDIKKFYPSIDQDILLEKFNKKLKDAQTLRLIEKIVRSVPSGVPIGNYTSQWFANFFLQDFDHYVKEQLKIKYYIRYMDDMVFFSGNKKELGKKKKLIFEYLEREKLTVKPNYQLFRIGEDKKHGRPIDFLGYKFYRNHTNMRSKSFLRMTRRIRKISNKEYLTAKDSSAVISYSARIRVASGVKLYNKYFKPYINVGKCRWTVSRHDKKKAYAEKMKKQEENS